MFKYHRYLFFSFELYRFKKRLLCCLPGTGRLLHSNNDRWKHHLRLRERDLTAGAPTGRSHIAAPTMFVQVWWPCGLFTTHPGYNLCVCVCVCVWCPAGGPDGPEPVKLPAAGRALWCLQSPVDAHRGPWEPWLRLPQESVAHYTRLWGCSVSQLESFLYAQHN